MHRVCDDLGPMSLRLSRVLDDVGVCGSMMGRRRRTYLQHETMQTIGHHLAGRNVSSYCFGSQSEGTTTTSMGSDLDILVCINIVNLMQDWHEWQAGKCNFLMIKDETTPPRHRTLQKIRYDSPEPVTILDEDCIYDQSGRVLLKNNMYDNMARRLFNNKGNPFVKQGPSRSWCNEIDVIPSFKCKTLPRECQAWLDRPRSGYWPTPEMLIEARNCGCFLLPVGHPESEEYEPVEWRLSPSLIERMLLFRLNVVQLKCYVILKLIKTSLLKPMVGDHLTSFHCKTALLYTIENIPPIMWKENNLIQCVQCCFRTLSKFLHKGFCPHYIIPDMNLFAGKLSRQEQNKLNLKVKSMLDCNLEWLFNITCDQIGPRLQNITTVPHGIVNGQCPSRFQIHADLAASLHLVAVKRLCINMRTVLREITETCHIPSYVAIKLLTYMQTLLLTRDDHSFLEQHVATLFISHLCSVLASILASISIFHGLPISPQTLSLFRMSLNTDVASSRLKLASMLYSRGQYEVTASVLHDVENRYGDHVKAVCGCGFETKEERIQLFTSRCLMSSDNVVKRDCVAYCVRFLRQEACCVPGILLYEMFRSTGDDIRYRHYIEHEWMDWAVVDALPYLYYLQYLTYRELGRRDLQLIAIQNLRGCFLQGRVEQLYHGVTAVNLLGHCYEMENMVDVAYDYYQQSLNNEPRNNAANRHIHRLLNH